MAENQEGGTTHSFRPPGYEKGDSNALWQNIDGNKQFSQTAFHVSKESGLGSQQR